MEVWREVVTTGGELDLPGRCGVQYVKQCKS